jgi:serine/threonine protein kinase/Tfp pilus assembly protein PilF
MPENHQDNDKTQTHVLLMKNAKVGHYRIVKRIGSGGMGEVYLAEDTQLNRKAALKFLSPQYRQDHRQRARFIREAQAAARLSHPNIVTVYEISEWENRIYIAMEYINGQSLSDLFCAERLKFERAVEIMFQVCEGLEEAHLADVVHRDIKPSNIVVDRRGRCRILDFGLARFPGDSQLTKPGIIVGTVDYMSPEQAEGKVIDKRSDLFSLGVLFYQMLTGHLPFKRDGIAATIHAIVNDVPKEVETYLPELPGHCQQIINKALAKKPEQRYQSAADLLADLALLRADKQVLQNIPLPKIAQLPSVQSLAVLYLQNLGSEEDEYLSYGITEDLIIDLTRIGSLRVVPMRTVLRLKESDLDLPEIAEKLSVAFILDGSLRRSENTIHASIQLIDVESGKNLWAERWHESIDQLHKIRTEVENGVCQVLSLGDMMIRNKLMAQPKAYNPGAYEYYLRGKYAFSHRHSRSDIQVAKELFDKALDLEPALVAAQAEMAMVMIHEGHHIQAAEKLMTALKEAQRHQQRADETHILTLLARCFSMQNKWAKASEFAMLARRMAGQLGDLAGEAAALSSHIDIYTKRDMYDEAFAAYERVQAINRHLDDREKEAKALNMIGTVYLHKGDHVQARAKYKEAMELAIARDNKTLEASCLANIGLTYNYSGDPDKAASYHERSLNTFRELGDQSQEARALNNIAVINVNKGAYRQALDFFEQAAAIHEKLHLRDKYTLAQINSSFVLTIFGEFDNATERLLEALHPGQLLISGL